MPSVIPSTTLGAIEAAVIARIAALEPTHVSQRAEGWKPTEDNRPIGKSSEQPRLFYVEVGPGEVRDGALTGNGDIECEAELDVVADYRAFVEDERGTVVEADQWDLYDDLENAINVIPGLTGVEIAGEPQQDGDEDAQRFRFPFTLLYMRARRG